MQSRFFQRVVNNIGHSLDRTMFHLRSLKPVRGDLAEVILLIASYPFMVNYILKDSEKRRLQKEETEKFAEEKAASEKAAKEQAEKEPAVRELAAKELTAKEQAESEKVTKAQAAKVLATVTLASLDCTHHASPSMRPSRRYD